ncbi:MAG: hypothetical protein ACXWWC_07575 [Chitinophagaceae bacterium]
MIKRENILQELQELKSSLAGAGFQNTYQAPAGYFDGLADEMLKRVRALESTTAAEELINLSPLLSSVSKQLPYSVPAGYFEGLEKKLEQSISNTRDQTTQEELEHLSPLLNELKKKNTYTIPAGYFEWLGKSLKKITSIADDQAAQEELEALSPLLSQLKKKRTYSVPVGYFENMQPAVKKANGPTAKVISITSRKWFRYPAVAMVIGIVATVGLLIFNKQNTIDPSDKSYSWIKKNLKKVSTDDINEFVELANAGTADVAKTDAKDEISNLLKDVSDKEIQDFLNDTQTAESETGDVPILN